MAELGLFILGILAGAGLLAVLCSLRRSGEIAQRENAAELGRKVTRLLDRWN
jgi:hypothetical protein